MMKFTAAAAHLFVLHQQTCHASTPLLRANQEEEQRKLQSYDPDGPMSSPLNDYGMGVNNYYMGSDEILQPKYTENGYVCYQDIFTTITGGPTTADFLVMFNENFVYNGNDRNIFAAPPQGYYPQYFTQRGLYNVIDGPGSCVMFGLLYTDPNIGQIVASSQFDPIEIIGITGTTIYGYYIDNGMWTREQTKWGDAKDGSLNVDPVEGGLISGLSTNDRMFTLWGSFDPDSSDPNAKNFNYAKHDDVECASRPTTIGDWTGFWAGSRGTYCPSKDNNQLWKRTWHSSGSGCNPCGEEKERLIWTPADKIARLGPKTNIFGISTTGKFLTLWDDRNILNPGVRSVTIDHSRLNQVRALGGLDDGWGHGVFAVTGDDGYTMTDVYNVYWKDGWISKRMNLYPESSYAGGFVLFGNYNGKTYVLYQEMAPMCADGSAYYIKRFDFVGGSQRYDEMYISEQFLPDRRRRC